MGRLTETFFFPERIPRPSNRPCTEHNLLGLFKSYLQIRVTATHRIRLWQIASPMKNDVQHTDVFGAARRFGTEEETINVQCV